MSNCLFAFPDRTIESASAISTTGTAWSTSFPLSNMKNRLLSKRARSAGVTTAHTKWTVDLGQARDVRVIALLSHNASLTATVRIRAFSDSGLTVMVKDVGTVPFYTASFTADQRTAYPKTLIIPITPLATARYWFFEVTDTSNSDGYFEVGRCVLAPALEPIVNMSQGVGLGLSTTTQKDVSVGSVNYYESRPIRRTVRGTLPLLQNNEPIDFYMMQRNLDINGEVLFVYDAEDTSTYMMVRSFLGNFDKLDGIQYPWATDGSMAFDITEII
jgi:hypothetical protein